MSLCHPGTKGRKKSKFFQVNFVADELFYFCGTESQDHYRTDGKDNPEISSENKV